MKIKLMPLFGGLLALSVASAPFILKAQAETPDQPAHTQKTRQHHGMWDKLNLSDQQKSELKQIHNDIRNQIKAVFTPEQQAQLEAARQNRQANQANQANQAGQPHRGKHSAMAALNLTDAQKAKIKAIKQEGKRRFEAVLTNAQKQQLEQMRQQWQQKRQQRQQQQQNNQ